MNKKSIKEIIKKYENIEQEFFDIDEQNRIAVVKLHFEKPSDIFDVNYSSKRAILSDDFMEWVSYAFDMIPKKYKIDLEVTFDDFEGLSEEQLKEDYFKCLILDYKTGREKAKKKNKTAFILIGLGVGLFILMMLINKLWDNGGTLKEIFSYVLDIATTVTIWEAMNILLVEKTEENGRTSDHLLRFSSIRFTKSE